VNTKAKGTKGERDLIKLFWTAGFAAIRVAGSGSSHFPCPDLLAGKANRHLAIECKVTKENSKYFTRDEINELDFFCKTYGAEGFVAVKFPKTDWAFFILEDLKETKAANFSIALKDIATKGLSFEQLCGFF